MYVVKDKLLKRYVIDGNNTYETTIIPRAITAQVLWMAHDNLGHNGTTEHTPCLRGSIIGKG